MCSPEYFGVTYDINPWMSSNIGLVDHEIAQRQWNSLYMALKSVASVEVMPGVSDLPDLVFTANAGLVNNNIAIVSTFHKQQRQPEELHFEKWFKDNDYTVLKLKNSYEGEGDHLVDKWNRHWMGTGFRSSYHAALELDNILNVHVNILELVDPRWYHLDTCFCPLPNGELMWYPMAFSANSQNFVRQSFTKTIDLTEEDALNFSCNAVCIGNEIFMPKNKNASILLEESGYKVHEFDLSEFMKAGGAAKCLVLDLGILPE
jgi:N-dimethylarginine dimethylaminohydrolase